MNRRVSRSPHTDYRDYDPKRDKDAVRRIWREIGWLEKGQERAMDLHVEAGHALVADVRGEPECLVTTAPGTIRYLDEDLPFACITGVATGQAARRRGLARRATAQAVAANVADGALVAGLGMFDQGFYNQLGFGSGGYEHVMAFDPSELNVKIKPRAPRRITSDDWSAVHAARLARPQGHGHCDINPAEWTESRMIRTGNGLGLGYFDDTGGELTHHFWGGWESVGRGPFNVDWLVSNGRDQFLELMALIRSLGDQVRLVRMREPPGVQLQDLVSRPLGLWLGPGTPDLKIDTQAVAYWQMRICDLTRCLALTHLRGGEVRFNLKITDPIERFLDAEAPWRGVAGDYVVVLGPSSGAEPGTDSILPTLVASVGAFTRMWLGVRPATGLSMTDELSGPQELFEGLDWVLRLPDPKPDWDF